MPRVPEYNKQTVAPQGYQGLQNPDTQPGAFGAGLAAGLANAASDATDVGTRMRAEDIKNKVSQKQIEFRVALNEYNLSPESLFNQTSGNANEEAYRNHLTKVQEMAQGIADSTEDQAIKNGFLSVATDYLLRESESGANHVAKERKVFRNEVYDAEQVTAQQDMAARPYDNPDPMLKQIAASVTNQGRNNGWDQASIDLKIKEKQTAGHAASLDAMMAKKDWEGAKAYIEKYGPTMQEDIYADKLKQVTQGGELGQALDIADMLTATNMSLPQKNAYIRDMGLDDDVRLAAERQTASLHAAQEAAQTAYRADVVVELQSWLLANPRATAADVATNFPSQWNALTPPQQNAMRNFQNRYLDPKYEAMLIGMIDSGKGYEAQKLIEKQGGVGLTATAENKLLTDISKGAPLQGELTTPKTDFDKAVKNYLGSKPKNPELAAQYDTRYYILAGQYRQAADQWKRDNPGTWEEPPAEKREEILADVMYKDHKEGWSVAGFEWGGADITLKNIPVEEVPVIEENLRKNNIPVTTANIIKRYREVNE